MWDLAVRATKLRLSSISNNQPCFLLTDTSISRFFRFWLPHLIRSWLFGEAECPLLSSLPRLCCRQKGMLVATDKKPPPRETSGHSMDYIRQGRRSIVELPSAYMLSAERYIGCHRQKPPLRRKPHDIWWTTVGFTPAAAISSSLSSKHIREEATCVLSPNWELRTTSALDSALLDHNSAIGVEFWTFCL